MKNKKYNVSYASAVGSLIYVMVHTRPYITYTVGVVNRFLSNPNKKHWTIVTWIFIYLKGTSRVCLSFGNGKLVFDGFINTNIVGHINSRKSTSEYIITYSK